MVEVFQSVKGYSTISFEAAVKDALSKMPVNSHEPPDGLYAYTVEELGVGVGGLTTITRFFVEIINTKN